MDGDSAPVAVRWFVLGILTGATAVAAFLVAHNLWGNQGESVAFVVVLVPIIIVERWLVLRVKERGSHRP